ncbi:MAG: alpha/beta hydrolase [Alphaproteobacteria bacterium]|nr:alpha/beta hydrolase [Alphaproteobacteria bacterium]
MSNVTFFGAAGRIEGRYHHTNQKNAPIALILHPRSYPQTKGTMNNKVVCALYRSFADLGFNTLRFNFRGAGRSEGTYDNGEGELKDAATALDWLQTRNATASSCWVAGFSFGAWVGMQLLMRRPEMEGFVSISLPADHYDFGFLAPCPVPGLVLHGDKDGIVSHTSVAKLVDKLQLQRGLQIDYRRVPMADHFFTEKVSELRYHVEDYLSKNLLRNSISLKQSII